MERAEWLREMRSKAETLYNRISPQYWVTFGFYENQTHLAYLEGFLKQIAADGEILSAGCGAGRYDGILLQAGHRVTGIDQSAGMLARAKEHFPEVRYEKMALQEIAFHEVFDGVICIDAMEHVCPEDYPRILAKFQEALKPGGLLYFTVDQSASPADLAQAFEKAKGLPVVPGELVDEVDESLAQVDTPDQALSGALADSAVYHFYPPLEQVRGWINQAGLEIEEEGLGSGYCHFVARKRRLQGTRTA